MNPRVETQIKFAGRRKCTGGCQDVPTPTKLQKFVDNNLKKEAPALQKEEATR